MHTKTWVVASVMGLVLVLALFAFCARYNDVKKDSALPENNNVVSEVPVTEGVVSGDEVLLGEEDYGAQTERRALPQVTKSEVLSSHKFEGVLEEVNVGCFADGECYVVVGGKHVTTLMGWTSATVGSVKGVEGFGDLERFIGEEVEVYAGLKADGTYTLYENAEYYVALKNVESSYIKIGEDKTLLGLIISPLKLTEDSRCPVGLMCIQAGTVRIEASVSAQGETNKVSFELGEAKKLFGKEVTFLSVSPEKEEGFTDGDYSFYFSVK